MQKFCSGRKLLTITGDLTSHFKKIVIFLGLCQLSILEVSRNPSNVINVNNGNMSRQNF